jgi:hypothetical protein
VYLELAMAMGIRSSISRREFLHWRMEMGKFLAPMVFCSSQQTNDASLNNGNLFVCLYMDALCT